nr:hypothetical protein [uncultured Pedobacter sp.]
MKNQKFEKRALAFILTFLATTALYAQTGIEKAAQDFTTSAGNVKNYLEKGFMTLAFLAAAVGLITALNKANVEGENASKHYIKWFVAAGIFALAWAAMKTIFA